MIEIANGSTSAFVLKKSGLFNDSEIIDISLFLTGGYLKDINNENKRIAYGIDIDDLGIQRNLFLEKIKKNKNIRLWLSTESSENYMTILFVLNLLRENINDYNISIIDISKIEFENGKPYDICEISYENIGEILYASKKLDNDTLNKNLLLWDKLYEENSLMRTLENGVLKSVSKTYFDNIILEFLEKNGEIEVIKLVAKIMEYYNNGNMPHLCYYYAIDKLIENNKIVIVKVGRGTTLEEDGYVSESFFHSVIKIAD